MSPWLRTLSFLLVLLGVQAGDMSAQATSNALLPVEHWTRAGLKTLAAYGAIGAGDAVRSWPVRVQDVVDLFEQAASSEDSEIAELAIAYRDRISLEYAGQLSAEVQVVVSRVENQLVGGRSYHDGEQFVYPGPVRAGTDRAWNSTVGLDARFGPVSGDIRFVSPAGTMGTATVALDITPARIWFGRRSYVTGPAAGSSVLLSRGAIMPGVGIGLHRPVRLPGFLRVLGSFQGDVAAFQMHRSGEYQHPYFSAARVVIQPDTTVAFGFSRAVILGGKGNIEITPRTIALMLMGFTDVPGEKGTQFENQMASADISWSFRTMGGNPISLYGEWGFEDVGWSWSHVPGFLVGVEAGWFISQGTAFFGLELTQFSRSCCGNPPWYRHGALAHGWTDQGRLLGHPLGGHGRETAMRFRLEQPSNGVWFYAKLYERFRGVENLFSPDRFGGSAGIDVFARKTVGSVGQAFVSLSGELGKSGEDKSSNWTRYSAEIGFTIRAAIR